MRILVRMPNWLGDAVMATPALDNLRRHFDAAELTLVAAPLVAQLFACDPRVRVSIGHSTRGRRLRLAAEWSFARQLRREQGPFDLAVAFTNSVSSRMLVWLSGAPRRVAAGQGLRDLALTDAVRIDPRAHQAEIYNQVVNGLLGTAYETGPTSLYTPWPHDYPRPTLGINPGAAYGSAKRWFPERFVEVAAALADRFDIVLFAGPQERDMVAEIMAGLHERGVQNCQDLAGGSIADLVAAIAGLELFITNDSGPMHIAGAFGVPTVAIFGPTDHTRTCPWRHERVRIVRRDVECAPCMRRVCPLGHHACMDQVTAGEVIDAALAVSAMPRANCKLAVAN